MLTYYLVKLYMIGIRNAIGEGLGIEFRYVF